MTSGKLCKITIKKRLYLQCNDGTWYTDGKLAVRSSLTDNAVRPGEVWSLGKLEKDKPMPPINSVIPTKGEPLSEVKGLLAEIDDERLGRFFVNEKTGEKVCIDKAFLDWLSPVFINIVKWEGGAKPVSFWMDDTLLYVCMPIEYKSENLTRALDALKGELCVA